MEEQLTEGKLASEEDTREIKAMEMRQRFFEKKIERVEHDLFILNKNPMDV